MDSVLNAREERYNRTLELIDEYELPVICCKLNYPGNIKNTLESRIGFEILKTEAVASFRDIYHTEELHGDDGSCLFIVTKEKPERAKKAAVYIEENHPLGRHFDVDVYLKDGTSLERKNVGLPLRGCIICGKPARECMLNGRHSYDEIISKVNRRIMDYFERWKKHNTTTINIEKKISAKVSEEMAAKKMTFTGRAVQIGERAMLGMLYEAASYPSPGLVSPVSNGIHKDMDYYTFIKSTAAIAPVMYRCAQTGLDSDEDILKKLRAFGLDSERYMLYRTNGVNAQRGILFIGGVICAAAGNCFRRGVKPSRVELSQTVKGICKGIVEAELGNGKTRTYGERVFNESGIRGIRGEMEDGLQVVLNAGLPAFEKALEAGLEMRKALVHALISLMAETEDTTVIKRRGTEGLEIMKEQAHRIMKLGGMLTPGGEQAVNEAQEIFIKEGISPGGAADLLAATVMFYELEKMEG